MDDDTYFDDDVQVLLPVDRTLRYQKLKEMWAKRMSGKELRQHREAYGDYEWGIEVNQIEAVRQAIYWMEFDDQRALRHWCSLVLGT